MTWRGSAKRSGTKPLLRCVQTWWPTTRNIWPLWLPTRVSPPSTKSCFAKGSNTYLTHLNANQFLTFLKCVFLFFVILSLAVQINLQFYRIIIFLCQWANVQNQIFFPPTIYLSHRGFKHTLTSRSTSDSSEGSELLLSAFTFIRPSFSSFQTTFNTWYDTMAYYFFIFLKRSLTHKKATFD